MSKDGCLYFKAVIFDLDGTLLDSLEDIAESMNAVLKECGFPEHDPETYRDFIGEGIEQLVRQALPKSNRTDSMIERCVVAMRNEYEKRWTFTTRPYKGVLELIDELSTQGVRMAILSNKPDRFTKVITAVLLPSGRFDLVLGAKPDVPKKPDPLAALNIAALFNIQPQSVIFVGDSGIDMETAVSAGMYPVGVLWGFRPEDELIAGGAKALLDHPLELLRFFKVDIYSGGEK
ncbi:MAG: HAD family hydrolase [Deltaproteobacteria bacterium]|nr:HAD family hydrolase [Deltaproteobacteria bacterium]